MLFSLYRVSDQLSATITLESFFSAAEELDPILALGLGRLNLGTKIKKFAPPGSLSAPSNSLQKNCLKIINYQRNISMFGQLIVSPSEKQGIPGCMLVVGLSFSYPGITGTRVRSCVFSQHWTENHVGSRPLCSDARNGLFITVPKIKERSGLYNFF